MDQQLLEKLRGMSREERLDYFKSNKSDILSESDLSAVNGGAGGGVKNPNTEEVPYEGCWYTSMGFICNGEPRC